MILKTLRIWNFRQFSHKDDQPGLEVEFHDGINVLIGENDAGKSTIIDAIKIVLQTQSNEYIRISEEDFYTDYNGNSENEILIECILDGFSENEAKNFIEWLQFKKDSNGAISYSMRLRFKAWKEKNRIFTDFRAGMTDDGTRMDGKARELLKCTYLKPLRDAEREMHSRKGSRISQILYNHKTFENKDEHELVQIIKEANERISKYFTEDEGKEVLDSLQESIKAFLEETSTVEPEFVTSTLQLKSILESLSLNLSEIQPGLGVQNLLFIAAELLLLNHDDNGGIKLALIEEIEAHLHPQAQLRLIEYIQNEYDNSGVQFIISTHSPVIASKINIKNALLCKNSKVFSLAPGKTELVKGDYLFLQRFLESSRANMFFSQGVILVEGDAENLLIPVMAKIIGFSLSQCGVSLVNVGSTAFLRYSRIFLQKGNTKMEIPVSIVTDVDVEPTINGEIVNPYLDKTTSKIEEIKENYDKDNVKTFVAPNWTLEYTLALSCLRKELYLAILYADKIQNSNEYTLTTEKIISVDKIVDSDLNSWKEKGWDNHRIAYEIYNNKLLEKKISKAITAQCLASILLYEVMEFSADDELDKSYMFDLELYQKKLNEDKRRDLSTKICRDSYLGYIVGAINYAARR